MPQIAKLFRALADPNRLRIVDMLSCQSLCVRDLQAALGVSQPFISRHLAYLRRAGVVQAQREGTRMVYSLSLSKPVGQAVRPLLCLAGQNPVALQADELRPFAQQPNAKSNTESLNTESDEFTSRAA
jgi:ArsR family transcriptional regulator